MSMRMLDKWSVGTLLKATGIGHAVVGLILFYDPLAAILRDGFFNAVYPHFDREAAFWFMLFSPICFALGQVVDRAVERRDRRVLTLVGWYLLGMGIVGVLVLPISGFWILIALAALTFRAARGLEPRSASVAGASGQAA